jgi:sugar lactone lactonase YvrE
VDGGNNRLLVYSNPFASLPGQNSNFNAIRVFGQGSTGSEFTLNNAAAGQTGLGFPTAVAVDSSSNVFVMDAGNNRVLEYFAGDVAADRVFGQTNFNSNLQNQGGAATGATLSTSANDQVGLAVDGHGNLYAADPNNNRVVEYNGPFATVGNDPPANITFSLTSPRGVAVDAANTLYVASGGNILQFKESTNPPSNTIANLTFGNSLNIANSVALFFPLLLGTDRSNNLYVADANNNRVLEYYVPGPASPAPPGSPGDTVPDQVLGQETFGIANVNFVDGRSLGAPTAVAIDLSANPNHVYILDASNNRVLGWKSLSEFTGNQPADLVVGQPDFFGAGCNQPQTLGGVPPPTAQTLCLNTQGPLGGAAGVHSGIAVDKHGNLFVADQINSRVLEFSNPFAALAVSHQSSAFTASTVFGQNGSFSTAACNLVTQPGPLSPIQGSLCLPDGVAFDPAGNLYLADAGNSRALEFTPDSSGSFGVTPAPNTVFGQGGSYTTAICANGAGGNPAPGAGNLCGFKPVPASSAVYFALMGVATDSAGDLYIADYWNNRVLEFTPTSPGAFGVNPTASLVFGQGAGGTSFTTNQCGIGTTGLCGPASVASDPSGNLYVLDTNARVLEYNESTLPAANVIANHVFGQADFGASGCNSRGLSAISLCFYSVGGLAVDALGHLYIADSGNNRVIEFDSPLSPSPPAVALAGVSPSALVFAGQLVGTTSLPQTVTLSNTGNAPLTITAISASGDFSADGHACGSSLAAGKTCSIRVAFTPTVTGARSGTLTMTDNNYGVVGSTQKVSLSGTGTVPLAGISPSALVFAGQLVGTTSLPQTVTLSNTGNAPLTITAISTSGDFSADGFACGTSLAAGTTCSISVAFKPTAAGARSATLTVTDNNNAVSGSTQTVSLSGTGTDFTVSASPASQTISSGHTATYSIAVAPVSGFTGSISLTCNGGPPGSTCTIAPGSVALSGPAAANGTVDLSTPQSDSHGTFPVVFTGASGTVMRSAAASLTIK